MNEREPTIQDLLAAFEELKAENIALRKENAALRAENEELKRRLNRNSRNSSKPPSSDGLSKPKVNKQQSLRKSGQHKSGGQSGHKGHTLKQVSHPDQIVVHGVSSCPKCEADLSAVCVASLESRQVFDIPKPILEVTEHQSEVKHCPCCQARVKAAFPDNVTAPVQYGDNIRSWSAYLSTQHFIPEDRLQQLFSDLYGLKIATSTLVSFNEKLSNQLEVFESSVKKRVAESALKHLDETGYRASGKTCWLHTASTQTLTYYHVSMRRKSLLADLKGIVVHDHWKPYFQLPNVLHALCNAHHLRELNARIEEDEQWAKKMKRLLLFMLKLRKHYGQRSLSAKKYNWLIGLYSAIIDEGMTYHEGQPKLFNQVGKPSRKKRKGHNLLLRLKVHCAEVLRFLLDPRVPFTNNLAEQDLRMMKCKQKITGGFKTHHGAKTFARIRGFISTARKQQWNILESISLAMQGNAPLPN